MLTIVYGTCGTFSAVSIQPTWSWRERSGTQARCPAPGREPAGGHMKNLFKIRMMSAVFKIFQTFDFESPARERSERARTHTYRIYLARPRAQRAGDNERHRIFGIY